MGKNVVTKLLTLLMALVLMVTAIPVGNMTADAATKPGAVSKVKISKITKNSAKVTYRKAKKAKGYQIRVYKGKKQVLSKKTKALSYNIKKLKANTKYTVKVRAYNGKKYGKQFSVSFKTKKNTAKNPTSTPEDPTPEPPAPTPEPPQPGTSTSEGEQLVAEYNAYVAHIAADWSDPARVAWANQDSSVDCLNTAWLRYTVGMFSTFTYSDAYTDKYQAYKHNCGTLDAITDYYADVLTACGLTVTVSSRDPKEDYDRYNKLYAVDANWNEYYDSRIHKVVTVVTQDGKIDTGLIIPAPSRNGLSLSRIDPASLVDGRTIVGTCPGCGNQIRRWDTVESLQKCFANTLLSEKVRSTISIRCITCCEWFDFTNPYYNTDLNEPVYIRTTTLIPD